MIFHLYANKTNIKEYTLRLIRHLFEKHSIPLTDDPAQADYVLVSVCDSDEISDIEKAKKYAKPVIVGGMISEVPILNELADYVYHGEIYGLIDHIKAGGGIEDCEHITSSSNKKLNICQEIRWEENPVIKVGKRSAYYYCAKGCPVRCKYCLIGNARRYQAIPEPLYRKTEKMIERNKAKMMPIAAYNPHAAKTQRAITEVLMKEYIQKDGLGLKNSMIRSGVEFVDPENSSKLAKGVTIEHVNQAIEIAKRDNSRMILYFISGLEDQEQCEEFWRQINQDYSTKPAVTVVHTYLAPQPMTPIFDFDIRERVQIDAKKLYHIVNNRNKRFRFMPLANIKKSTMRAFKERCLSLDEYQFVKSLGKKSVGYDDMVEQATKKYPHLLGTATLGECLTRKRGHQGVVGGYWS